MSPITTCVDLRCLQDPNYQFRGVGRHVAALLRHAHGQLRDRVRLVGVLDEAADPLPEEYRALLADVQYNFYAVSPRRPGLFINPSPMTHDPVAPGCFLGRPGFVTAAVVYDFIPWDRAGYLPDDEAKADYVAQMAWLRHYDLLLPISRYSAQRLRALCGVPQRRICVTGAAVREVYAGAGPEAKTSDGASHGHDANDAKDYFVLVGGADPRKNAEVVVQALARLNQEREMPLGLCIVGHYPAWYARQVRALYGANGGSDASALRFVSGVDDAGLARLYADAIATVVPSFVEGFSLPVVEAAMCGSPVIASACGAHRELLQQPEALFPADDVDALAQRLQRVATDSALRRSLAARQSLLSRQFEEGLVGERFWSALLRTYERQAAARTAPFVQRGRKPRLAVLSPYLPDASGVAEYTAQTLQAAGRHFDIALYTDARVPTGAATPGCRVAGRVSLLPALRPDVDCIVSVLGNHAGFHGAIFDVFERIGGPCILHDSRLLHYYLARRGPAAVLEMAARSTGLEYGARDIDGWIADESSAPSPFLEPIVRKAAPLMVHTRPLQDRVRQEYGVEAQLIEFATLLHLTDAELSGAARAAARRRLGMDDGVLHMVSFGEPLPAKGTLHCIWAVEFLRQWKIPAVLHLVGSASAYHTEIQSLVGKLGLKASVRFGRAYVTRSVYLDYMLAADCAVQLRTYGFGQMSGALVECISAGLPTVASEGLAEACDATRYVQTVPNHPSAVRVAECIANLVEAGAPARRLSAERNEYQQRHSFENYALNLKRILVGE